MANENTSPGAKPLLPAALLKAQREVQAALKGSKNNFHNYKYASAEEVLTVGRDALNDAGLSLYPQSETIVPLPCGTPAEQGGATGLLRVVYVLLHESGESREIETHVPICPEQSSKGGWARPLDKALFGARTESLGYVLRDLLLIPRVDAPDVSGRADRGERPQRQEQPRSAVTAPTLDKAIDEAVAMTRGATDTDQKREAWKRATAHVGAWCKANGKTKEEIDAAILSLGERAKKAASNGNAPAAHGGA